ncbi:protein kinase C substrate 80K-H [Strigomonas culicis]|uniref:Glucosidase 2 subunit beta n=1 Tax=Strigomonas culicis TaxID=28005 RepID=S9VL32_9TRYP|nr:protein kinase C substrate 80K-H [Strigomonas culicis]|eukprot:EPY23905.1 protein kinase C substrate 80K-H [Strigomonas culicis]
MWKSVFFLLSLLCACVVSCVSFRGVPDGDRAQYFIDAEKKGEFTCFNNEKVIPFSHVNDDICDCSDGSDEPGTGACTLLKGTELRLMNNTWKFRCVNKGYEIQEIAHYKVNDGICDCCDGSDEVGTVPCVNNCAAIQDALAKARLEKEAILREARKLKQEYQQMAVQRLKELEENIISLEEKLKNETAEAAIVDAELEKMEKKEAEEKEKIVNTFIKWHEDNDNQQVCLNVTERMTCSDENVRRMRPCFDRVERYTSVVCHCADPSSPTERQFNFSCDHDVLDCFYVCSHGGEAGISVPSDGQYFRLDEADELRMKKSDLRESIEKAQKDLEFNRMVASKNGTMEFNLRLINGTFSILTNKCTFEFALFGEFNQLEGNARHKVGQFDSFGESLNSLWSQDGLDYTVLKYKYGAPCGQGRSRSGEVKLVCGTENKVLSGSEPSMCVYKLVFQTPFVCEDY